MPFDGCCWTFWAPSLQKSMAQNYYTRSKRVTYKYTECFLALASVLTFKTFPFKNIWISSNKQVFSLYFLPLLFHFVNSKYHFCFQLVIRGNSCLSRSVTASQFLMVILFLEFQCDLLSVIDRFVIECLQYGSSYFMC